MASKIIVDGVSSRDHPLYVTWRKMKNRCNNPKNERFKDYGGRGIKVCEHWNKSFVNFVADVGSRPEGHTLDRIDNDGNYEPSNCKWSTYKQQSNNCRERSIRCDNKTGVKGVSLHKMTGRYQATTTMKSGRKYLGLYDTVELAEKALIEYMNIN